MTFLQLIFPGVDPNRPKTTFVEKLQIAAAEFFGTAMFIFVGCVSCVDAITITPTLESICICFGAGVMISIIAIGHVSGGHLNPSVSLSAILVGKLKEIELVPIYMICQVLGSCFGYGIIRVITPTEYFVPPLVFDTVMNKTVRGPGICTTVPSPKITLVQAFVLEVTETFILVIFCCGVWDRRNTNHDSVAVKFGFGVTGLAISGATYTGCSMNPARSFGPALFNKTWKAHWLFWAGPFSGSILASITYRLFFGVAPLPYDEPE